MSLVTEPVLVTNHSLIYNRPRADKWDQGITSIAKNYGATRFSIVTEALRSGRYRAKINYLGKCDRQQ